MSDYDRNDFKNLLLLCYVHHRTIDGSRWQQYTVEMLKGWKSERESSKSSALQTLHDITEDRLQGLIIGALKDRNDQIAVTLTRLERNDAQAASLLREMADELAALRGRGSILDPDAVSMLDDAAHRLGHLSDTASWLEDAAQRLGHLQDTAVMLQDAADRLESAAGSIRGLEGLGGVF